MIFSGAVGKSFVSDVYNGLNEIPNIESAINYCLDVEKNQEAFSSYSKVQKFCTNEDQIIASTKEMASQIIVKGNK